MNGVPFHEFGRRFIWSIAAKKVFLQGGGEVEHGVFNLQEARVAARSFIRRQSKYTRKVNI